MRIHRKDTVDAVVPHLRKAGHVQLDFELTKINILELNRFGCYGQQIAFLVIRQTVEFLISLGEFLVDLGN